MPNVDFGAPVKAVWAGAPAGGTFAVAITRPDATTFTPPAIVNGPPVSVTFTPNMAGRWLITWTSSGTGTVGAYSDVVNVWPTDPRFIISLDDAKAQLGMPDNVSSAALEDLRLYVAAATPIIEDICGTVVTKTVTQVVDGNKWGVVLWEKPTSITSITEGGTNPGSPVVDYVVDWSAGIIFAGRTFAPRRFQPGFASVTIVYTAGSVIVGDNIRLAVRELVRHWWQLGKQGARPQNGNLPLTAEAWTPSGFAVPRRVIELCTPTDRVGGFA